VFPPALSPAIPIALYLSQAKSISRSKSIQADAPKFGEPLYFIPRHVCPTVNNVDDALIIESNRVVGVEMVTAHGHESPLRSNIRLSRGIS
jgi:D-serine deaminase-like pyridoxal phosphate-dependent protein